MLIIFGKTPIFYIVDAIILENIQLKRASKHRVYDA